MQVSPALSPLVYPRWISGLTLRPLQYPVNHQPATTLHSGLSFSTPSSGRITLPTWHFPRVSELVFLPPFWLHYCLPTKQSQRVSPLYLNLFEGILTKSQIKSKLPTSASRFSASGLWRLSKFSSATPSLCVCCPGTLDHLFFSKCTKRFPSSGLQKIVVPPHYSLGQIGYSSDFSL